MIVKCPNNVILDVLDNLSFVKCPDNCPKRKICKKQMFTPKPAKGMPMVVVRPEVIEKPQQPSIPTPLPTPLVETREETVAATTSAPQATEGGVSSRFKRFTSQTNNERQQVDEFIELENCEDVIIYIGCKNYYAPKYALKRGYANIEVALYEIFKHWNTDVVFNSETEFTNAFTNVLKLKFKNKYKEIVEDILSKDGSINSKFYRLFYHHIYFGSSITTMFYFENEYQEDEIKPLITNEYDLAYSVYSRLNYMCNFYGCEKELLDYLKISSMTKLLNKLVKRINEKFGSVVSYKTVVDVKYREYAAFNVLSKTTKEFIDNLTEVETNISLMENKIEFLKQFELFDNNTISERSGSFTVSDLVGVVDDGVYDLLGISTHTSGQAKDMLKLYLALLKEYIKIRCPREIKIGPITLSTVNFYNEIKDVVNNAYSKCIGDNSAHDDIKKLYLLLVLKNNGILEKFNYHTTTKVDAVISLIKENINYSDYMHSEIEDKKVFFEGKTVSIDTYFREIIEQSDEYQLSQIINNDAIFKLLEESVNKEDLKVVKEHLVNVAKKV